MLWESVIGALTVLMGIVWTGALWKTENQAQGRLARLSKISKVRSQTS